MFKYTLFWTFFISLFFPVSAFSYCSSCENAKNNLTAESAEGMDNTGTQYIRRDNSQLPEGMYRLQQGNEQIGFQNRAREKLQQAEQLCEQSKNRLNLNHRNRWTRFLLGPDKSVLSMQKEQIQNNNQMVKELSDLKENVFEGEEYDLLDARITDLKNDNSGLQTVIDDQQKFSLFGWLFNNV